MPSTKIIAVALQVLLIALLLPMRAAIALDQNQNPNQNQNLNPDPNGDKQSDSAEILELTNKLLFQELDLERFYVKYRIYGNEEPKTRRVRFFALQQAAGGAFLGSNIANTIETAKHFRSPGAVSSRVFTRSGRTGLVGSVLGMSSSSLELASNGYVAVSNKIKGHDPGTARKTVQSRLKTIDDLSKRRDELVAKNKDSAAYELYVEEGLVLKTFRDWCVYEFTDVYSDIKSNQSSNNVFYALDIGAYAVSLASYTLGLESTKHEKLVYPALDTGFVSDALFTAEAPMTVIANKRLYNFYWTRLARQLNEKPMDAEEDAKKQMYKLESLAAYADESTKPLFGNIASRLAIYSFWSVRYDKYIDKRQGEIRRQSRIALQSEVSGPLLGLSGLTQDTCNAVGLYGAKSQPFMSNALAFSGACTSTVGSAASVGLSGWWFADQVRHDRNYKRVKVLPEMLLEDRLRTLAILEEMLEAPH